MDLLTLCNWNCSYCYANRYNKKKQVMQPSLAIHIIKTLCNTKLPVFIGIQGGEPSLYPMEMLKSAFEEFLSTKQKNRLYLTTNFSKPQIWLKFLSGFKNTHKIYLLLSFHPEYSDESDFLTYLRELLPMVRKIRVNIMLHPHAKFYRKLKELIYKLLDFGKPSLEIHPHFLYVESTRFWSYPKEFWSYFRFLENIQNVKYINVKTKRGSFLLGDYEYFYYGFHSTVHGMLCYHNNFEIFVDGTIKNLCMDRVFQLQDLVKISVIKPVICPNKQCCCDGLIKIYKHRIQQPVDMNKRWF